MNAQEINVKFHDSMALMLLTFQIILIKLCEENATLIFL